MSGGPTAGRHMTGMNGGLDGATALRVTGTGCAAQRQRSPACDSPPREVFSPGATGAGMEVTKCLEPDNGHVGDRAGVQKAGAARRRPNVIFLLLQLQAAETVVASRAVHNATVLMVSHFTARLT